MIFNPTLSRNYTVLMLRVSSRYYYYKVYKLISLKNMSFETFYIEI